MYNRLAGFADTPIPFAYDSFESPETLTMIGLGNTEDDWNYAGLGQQPVFEFGGLGIITSEAGFNRAFADLVRGAAIKTLRVTGLQGMNNSHSFEKEIEEILLDGLASGDLRPISKGQFERKLSRMMSTELAGMDGWLQDRIDAGKRLIDEAAARVRGEVRARARALKALNDKRIALARKVADRIKGEFKARARALKALNDKRIKFVQKIGKSVAKVIKDNLPLIKKVMVVAAIGAALYFGGPLVWGAMKSMAPAMLAKAKTLMGLAAKVGAKLGIGKGGITDPNDPRLAQANAMMAQEQLAQQGINMSSPEAQGMLQQYGAVQNRKLMGGMDITKIAMIGIPVAAAAYFFMTS